MDYSCPKCSRVFSCAEAISFCPFCGTAYASAPGASAVSTTRIVIGSDSERAVQEKYWNLTHAEISLVLSALEGRLPSHEEYTLRQLNVRGWLISQSKRSSTAQFRGGCDAFLAEITQAFQSGPSAEPAVPPIDIDQMGKAMDDICQQLLNVIRPEGDLPPLPQLAFQPINTAAKPICLILTDHTATDLDSTSYQANCASMDSTIIMDLYISCDGQISAIFSKICTSSCTG